VRQQAFASVEKAIEIFKRVIHRLINYALHTHPTPCGDKNAWHIVLFRIFFPNKENSFKNRFRIWSLQKDIDEFV
jgi:hypothetical protein